jgi:hypothetical protein
MEQFRNILSGEREVNLPNKENGELEELDEMESNEKKAVAIGENKSAVERLKWNLQQKCT